MSGQTGNPFLRYFISGFGCCGVNLRKAYAFKFIATLIGRMRHPHKVQNGTETLPAPYIIKACVL